MRRLIAIAVIGLALSPVAARAQGHGNLDDDAYDRMRAAAGLAPETREAAEGRCTYHATVWSARLRRTVRTLEVEKPKAELRPEERGPLGCTPCREDQREIRLSNGVSFSACARLADRLKDALEGALADGARVETVVGYRAQYSKGALNAGGERTELSNHAFGAALDVNEGSNGLYDRCVAWGPWRNADPLSHRPEHPVVRRMKAAGFSWGGEIAGRQKDFMHFSPTGY